MYAPPFLPSPEGGVGVVGVFDATLECIPTTLPTTDVAPQAVWYRPTIFMVGTQLRRSPKANWGTWTPVNSCSSHNQCAVRAVGRKCVALDGGGLGVLMREQRSGRMAHF